MKNNENIELNNSFVSEIRNIITVAKQTSIRSVDFTRVIMYWQLGERFCIVS